MPDFQFSWNSIVHGIIASAIVLVFGHYFIVKPLDKFIAKYSKSRREKMKNIKMEWLICVDNVYKNSKALHEFYQIYQVIILKLCLYILVWFIFFFAIKTNTAPIGDALISDGILIFWFLFIMVLIILSFSKFHTYNMMLRILNKRNLMNENDLNEYDKKKFGLTMDDVNESRKENQNEK